jgi:hypothetical protein
MNQGRNMARDARGAKTPGMASGRLGVCQGSGEGFRLASEAVKGVLMAFLWEVLRGLAVVFGKGVRYV